LETLMRPCLAAEAVAGVVAEAWLRDAEDAGMWVVVRMRVQLGLGPVPG
jgi:hypothetical protein